jgi:hypothetical protein
VVPFEELRLGLEAVTAWVASSELSPSIRGIRYAGESGPAAGLAARDSIARSCTGNVEDETGEGNVEDETGEEAGDAPCGTVACSTGAATRLPVARSCVVVDVDVDVEDRAVAT